MTTKSKKPAEKENKKLTELIKCISNELEVIKYKSKVLHKSYDSQKVMYLSDLLDILEGLQKNKNKEKELGLFVRAILTNSLGTLDENEKYYINLFACILDLYIPIEQSKIRKPSKRVQNLMDSIDKKVQLETPLGWADV